MVLLRACTHFWLQEERQEQLQAVTELAAVISGFEMIVFLQFQFDTTVIPRAVQLAYVATSGLTVSFALIKVHNSIFYSLDIQTIALLLLHPICNNLKAFW